MLLGAGAWSEIEGGWGWQRECYHVITRLARGAAERRLYDVIRAVPAEHVVAIGRDSHPVGIEDLLALPDMSESRLVRCPDLIRSVEPRSDLRAYRHLLGLMREGSFDVVHTHESKAGLLGRLAAKRTGVPLGLPLGFHGQLGPGYGPTASFVFAGVERASAPLVSRYFVVGAATWPTGSGPTGCRADGWR